MGDVLNHYMLIQASDESHAIAAHAKAKTTLSQPVKAGIQRGVDAASVGPIVQLPINGYWTFTIYPSGSKIGWDAFEHERQLYGEFVKWLRTQVGSDYEPGPLWSIKWAEVRIGGWAFGCGSIVTRSDLGDGKAAYSGKPGF